MGKKIIILLILGIVTFGKVSASEPDSAYIFAYAKENTGLLFAWSIDKEKWHAIGPEYSFVRNDYGRWGSQKKMFSPYLFQTKEGLWHCVWSLNKEDGAFGHVSTDDLIYWQRQSYPLVLPEGNCQQLEIEFDAADEIYNIKWISNKSGRDENYSVRTKDFKEYTPAKKTDRISSNRATVQINGVKESGTLHKVAWKTVDNLNKAQQLDAYKKMQWGERIQLDSENIKEPVNVSVTWKPENKKKISDLLIGVFFEDINYAADGGLYAELIQNRDFEYNPADKENRDNNWNSRKAWSVSDNNIILSIDTVNPIHHNNKNYAVLNIKNEGLGLINEGWDGIPLKAGEKYNFSIFARSPENHTGKLLVRLTGKNGEIYGEAVTENISNKWAKYEAVITSKETISDARLIIIPKQTGQVDLDMVSLFPEKTFKGRKNGLRTDLAQTIADMKPRFVRFPGGCVAHGDGLGNIYRWENTIGSLEERKPQRNLWGYHQTAGLGYFEYFQFCEDIGAEPVPVVAAGVPCQNSAHNGCPIGGQQGGIPMNEMDEYVQSILNLIEYANGDTSSEWGRRRAEAGHPEPFNLKYLGVGNEDLITNIFEERFAMIYKAVKEKFPDIKIIGTVGPFCEGTDYVEGWKLADELDLPMVDEHYYQSPGWYLNNQDYYDKYDRTKSKVYLGEYAAHLPGRPSNIETALSEALHLANVERNADIVTMTSYAPLLAKEKYTQWTPDLIYFNNTEVKPTVNYYVQKLYGQNSGDEYIPAEVSISDNQAEIQKRIAVSTVKDSQTGEVYIKLINLLPVEVGVNLDTNVLGINTANVQKTVLSGNLDDKSAKPIETSVRLQSLEDMKLKAHSLTVLKIK